MKFIPFSSRQFEPAAHEDSSNPGVLKKVLQKRDEVIQGRVQMINWALLPAGKSFRAHYHEDMDEIFILVSGSTDMKVNEKEFTLQKGDTVVVEMKEIHSMHNAGTVDIEYIVVGVTRETGGKTIVV